MGYIPGKTHIEAQAWGRGWIALWAGAGHQRLRHVARNGRAVVFPTEMEAYKAGLAAVQGTEPTVRAEAAKPVDHTPTFLDASQWREDRDERIRVERRQAFRGLGKGFLTVETKRRRA